MDTVKGSIGDSKDGENSRSRTALHMTTSDVPIAISIHICYASSSCITLAQIHTLLECIRIFLENSEIKAFEMQCDEWILKKFKESKPLGGAVAVEKVGGIGVKVGFSFLGGEICRVPAGPIYTDRAGTYRRIIGEKVRGDIQIWCVCIQRERETKKLLTLNEVVVGVKGHGKYEE